MSTKKKAVAPPNKTAVASKKPSPAKFDLKGQIGSLAAKLNEAQPGEKIVKMPLDKLRPNPNQHRKSFDKEALIELGNSIKNGRQELPAIVRPTPGEETPYMIVSGERRWRACGLAGVPTLDVVVRQISADDHREILLAEARENLHRVDLDVAEKAALAASLVAEMGIAEAVEQSGESKARLIKLVAIHKAAPVVSEVMSLGFVKDVETLYQFGLLAKENEAVAVQLAEKWKTNESSREHIRRQVEEKRAPKPSKPPAEPLQNDGNAKPATVVNKGESSATHNGQAGDEAPTRPVVRPAAAGAAAGRPADRQRSEPSIGGAAGGGTAVATVAGSSAAQNGEPGMIVAGARFEDKVIILAVEDREFRFDRASLAEVLGLDG